MIHAFVGYDPDESVAYSVAAFSIMEHASVPVAIVPLKRSMLPMLTRPKAATDSTDFSYSRFLVPFLSGYEGRSLYMDCDVLVRSDIAELWKLSDTGHALSVVKHDYVPRREPKFMGNQQAAYRCKNWSSVMVFNNPCCTALTTGVVNTATGMYLHQFDWLDSDESIAALPVEWNHLVSEYQPNPDAKIVHFTRGSPCFKAYSRCEFSDEWYACHERMTRYNRIGEFSMPAKDAA